jgi:hypothetical protein
MLARSKVRHLTHLPNAKAAKACDLLARLGDRFPGQLPHRKSQSQCA